MIKFKEIISKSYKAIAYTLVILMLMLINWNNFVPEDGVIESLKAILFCGIILSVLVLLNKFVIDKMNEKYLKILLIIGLIIFLILEIIPIVFLRVGYSWDFGTVMEAASDLAKTGTTDKMYYFKIFPNNIGALIIVTLSMIIFLGNEIGAYVINVLFVFLAVLFGVLSANKIGGKKLAVNTILLLIMCSPLYLYTPIVYTDTLSICFPVIIFYIWLCIKDEKKTNLKKFYFGWILLTVLACIAFAIKPVAAIIYVAIIIDNIFTEKKCFKEILLSIIVFILVISTYNYIAEKLIIREDKNNDLAYPYTHWVMMGLNKHMSEGGSSYGWGGYSEEDSIFTSSYSTYQEKKEANVEIIKERLNEFGISGYIKFLFKKFEYVWNDGSYLVGDKLSRKPINQEGVLYSYIVRRKF